MYRSDDDENQDDIDVNENDNYNESQEDDNQVYRSDDDENQDDIEVNENDNYNERQEDDIVVNENDEGQNSDEELDSEQIYELLTDDLIFSESGREYSDDPPQVYIDPQRLPSFNEHVGSINIPENIK